MPRFEPRALLGGTLVAAVGVAGAVLALDYPVGTLRRMGPGYLPLVLSSLLVTLGFVIACSADDADRGEDAAVLPLRPVAAVLAAVCGFALIVERFGLVPAIVFSVVVSASADPGSKPLTVLFMAVGAASAAVVIFVWGIGVPIAPVKWEPGQ